MTDPVVPMNTEMKVLAANRDPGIDTIEGETNLMIQHKNLNEKFTLMQNDNEISLYPSFSSLTQF